MNKKKKADKVAKYGKLNHRIQQYIVNWKVEHLKYLTKTAS
jgi:hypothetical protein